MKVLVTGIAGFLGSHVADYLLTHTDWELIGLTRLSHSGNLNRLAQMPAWATQGHRVRLVHHDLRSAISAQLAKQIGPVDIILHIGASTHVDRSIESPMDFILDNVVGTGNILEFARHCRNIQWFYYQSTDECHGNAPPGVFYREWDRHRPGNPYSATKSGGESLCLAYENTYKLPIIIGALMNLFGPFQHSEKMWPLCIRKILDGEEILIHADPTCTIPGRRTYLHTYNAADAIYFLLKHGVSGERYNIVGDREVDNLQLAEMIADIIGKPVKYQLVSWHASRPGHELRYGLDNSRMREMGWKPPVAFESALEETVQWYLSHQDWLMC